MKESLLDIFYLRTLKNAFKRQVVLVFLLLAVVVLNGCATDIGEGLRRVREGFHKSVREYNELLRLNEFDKAAFYVTESLREEFSARVRAAKGVKVVGYRVLSKYYQEKKGSGIVKVEIDYSLSSSSAVKTLSDNQKWSYVYVKEDRRKRWMVLTLLPEFK